MAPSIMTVSSPASRRLLSTALAAVALLSMRGAGALSMGRNSLVGNSTMGRQRRGPTREEVASEKLARSQRMRERRERFQAKLARLGPPEGDLTSLSREEFENAAEKHPWLRRTGWRNNDDRGDYEPYQLNGMADPSQSYDMWQQAYRMLGGFIDCDHHKDDDDNKSGDNSGDDEDQQGCSRWMMWAAYVDPNYQGNGYDEYFGDEPVGKLDCHQQDTEWQLLGVYRQEFYQFIEQISKHVWAIDEYEYVVALAGLAYMTDYDCWYVGSTNDGDYVYAGVQPLAEGKFQISLYTDDSCLYPDENLGMTFDDFGLTSNVNLASGSGDNNGDDDTYSWASEYWSDAQEYTLTNLNDVYEEFKYCTSCIDYPTYQDGYFIGDDGTDEDDLINQCWKFYSHDNFPCDADCLAKGHAQGTIVSVTYGDTTFGTTLSGYYSTGDSDAKLGSESRFNRLLANVFVTFSFVVFVATFLAFAVARRTGQRERSARSRRLLDDDHHHGGTSSRKSRSKSKGTSSSVRKAKSMGDEDMSRKKRSSKSGSSSKRSRSRRSGSRGRRDYEPPMTEDKPARRKSRSTGRSRRPLDDF